MRFEHVYGLSNAEHYQVGKQVDIWVDRKAPDRIARALSPRCVQRAAREHAGGGTRTPTPCGTGT